MLAIETLAAKSIFGWRPATVVAIDSLAKDIYCLQVETETMPLPMFTPGHYALLALSDNLIRPLSIACAPGLQQIEFHVKHIPGSEFTTRVSRQLAVGDAVRVAAPLGNAYLRVDSTRPILLLAGGTGFAPAKAIIEHLTMALDQRPLRLFWGARTNDEIYAAQILDELACRHQNFKWLPVLSEPAHNWHGAVGCVHEVALASTKDLHTHDVYLSGPPPMIAVAVNACVAAGVSVDQLFYDNG